MRKTEIVYHTQEIDPYSHSPSTTYVTTLVSIFFPPFDNFLLFLLLLKFSQEPVQSHALLPELFVIQPSLYHYFLSYFLHTLLYTCGKCANCFNKC